MDYKIDLRGERFGKLTVIDFAYKKNHFSYWKCKCDCGNEKVIMSNNLKRGLTKSCGCLRKKTMKEAMTTHGMSNDRLYHIWNEMKNRCNLLKCQAFKNYGERGIKICEEWESSFENFYKWAITNGYNKKLTIDRIDVNGNYEPTNCRWATFKEQAINKRNNRYLTWNGETHCLAEWRDITGISYLLIAKRIDILGWNVEKALTEPVRKVAKSRTCKKKTMKNYL